VTLWLFRPGRRYIAPETDSEEAETFLYSAGIYSIFSRVSELTDIEKMPSIPYDPLIIVPGNEL
jgi:hypothetical protein